MKRKDLNEIAFSVVQQAIGEAPKGKPPKNAEAVELGRAGGLKGGKARAKALSPDQRSAQATQAARARWGSKKP